MNNDEIRSEYFMWLSSLVSGGEHLILLKQMYETEFYSLVDRDYNLEAKAQDLRFEFYPDGNLPDSLCGPATIFEVLVVLANEMDYLLWNPEIGCRTAEWFWEMVANLGLDDLSDDLYFERDGTNRVFKALHKFLDRRYTRSGKGNIFWTNDKSKDFRHMEIWYQMNEYAKENFDFEGRRRYDV